MDDLAISPEELAAVTGTSSDPIPSPPPANQPLTLDDLPAGLGQGPTPAVSPAFPTPPLASPASAPVAAPDPMMMPDPGPRTDVTARPVQFAPLENTGPAVTPSNLDLLLGVTLQITVELGRTKMNIEEILHLGPGSVVELEKLAGEPVDVLVNDKMIARGEVVVLDDRFGVRITDVLPPAQRINSLR